MKFKKFKIYILYNILVSDRKKVDEIYTILDKHLKESRLNEFKKQVKLNSKILSLIKSKKILVE